MDKKVISLLRCPFCGNNLRLREVHRIFAGGKIRFGVVECACDVFPIVEGILYLKKTQPPVLKNQLAVQLLRDGRYHRAFSLLFDERRRAKLPYELHLRGFFDSVSLKMFLGIVKFFLPENKEWLAYLAARPTRPTFWFSLANLAYVGRGQAVVDVGCSIGWFLRYAHQHLANPTLIGVEHSFSALYLARKYVLKNRGNLICADANLGLPFRSGTIDRVFANDTFMYLAKKNSFLTEALRVGNNTALMFLSHVHSALKTNVGQGYGLTQRELKLYDKKYQLWGVSDQELFTALQTGKKQPYERLNNQPRLLQKPAHSLIMSKDGHFKPSTSPQWVSRLMKRASLNLQEDPWLVI